MTDQQQNPDPQTQEPDQPQEGGLRAETDPPVHEGKYGEETAERNPNREAAKYRRERNDARAERDSLREQIDGIHRAEVERRAAERFQDPRDLWSLTSLDELRGDDGLIDMDQVDAEFGRIEKDRPHWKKRDFPEIIQGPRGTIEEPSKPSFGQSIKRAIGGS